MSDIELAHATYTINIILYLVAFTGIVLVFLFGCLINKALKEVRLNKYRSKDKGFADLLNYSAMVDDGVIVLKNGGLLRGWLYVGPDESMLNNFDRNYISARLNDLFKSFDSGFVCHIDAIRRPTPNYFKKNDSFFPNKIAEAIDLERRNFFQDKSAMYDGFFLFSVTWFPPKIASRKIADAMFEKDGTQVKSAKQKTIELINEFKQKTHTIEAQLQNIFNNNVTPLNSYKITKEYGETITYDSLLSYLNFCLSGSWDPVRLPDTPVYLDDLLAQDCQFGIVPVIGRNFVMSVAIDNYPGITSPGLFNFLSELGCTYRWSTRYIGLELNEASALFKKLRKGWAQKQRGFFAQLFNLPGGRVNIDAVNMTEEADLADSEISAGEVSFGYVSQNIILMSDDLAAIKKDAFNIVKVLSAFGIKARIETVNTMEAFLGSLPGHAVENVRRPLLSTMNVADLLPVYSPWLGETSAPCPFQGYANGPGLMMCVTGNNLNTPFALNLHQGDLGHTLILGPTGAGKSTLLATLVAQFMRYNGMSIFAFDKGKSMYCLCKATGGMHYTPASDDSELAFAPLSQLETQADRAWAADWLQSIAELNGVKVTPDLVNLIDEALKNMMENKRVNDEYSMTLTNFATEVQSDELRNVLTQYLSGANMGTLLDATEDGLGDINGISRTLSVFEIENLMNLNKKYSLPVLTYLFHVIEKNLKGQPAIIVLDEAWLMLGDPTFREKIREWLKVLRKANCSVIMATQSLSDLERSGIMDVLLESCPTKIFLPNPEAKQDQPAQLYRRFGLNDAQIMLLSEAIKKRDYFFFNGEHSRMFQLALGKFTLAFVAVSDKKALEKIDDLIEKYGEEKWVDYYLEEKGINYPVEQITKENIA